ncbi:S-formylglutathione hydrolase [Desertifilum sp. FACHB-1129]|uniref:S-formylglutathione hydrolase n=1 Tax=Desertifilum tharense IPPAS B-1220 TaxID=1781255 RepID=A0A1E5QGF8_9CYAN|nr:MULTISPECIES: S-formylglutathione hydrolase [Desertifilum]MDA0211381.1 S-formylglutathione hydrolase [Cyanobacteria bacterium FC1]MBD2313574.1 S-formylglutathione hydrolase [Desertifilum sp. FACHB-1129]MBD2323906.1 S-formylglutathione hydrolase [Desertifilum sp. FACHB-866]MBD2333751.1 S-formylglutathione hydrolase [Desertifilum sp. FACHB-868]OEJ73772.1 S-formylglutathione hydrolase [Desertifilum tharense IPPAS B-1220]
MISGLELISQSTCFNGTVAFYSHHSDSCNGKMRFAVFIPPQALTQPVPILYFLSGLTCTEENFTVKAGAQRYAAEHGLMLVAPDTSPRDAAIPEEEESWDLGTGAGFYVDATQAPWSSHYRMYSYVVEELPEIITANFLVNPEKQGIFGHSMGGHGALICALRNPQKYLSVSAFAPIAAPISCPWGRKAFESYLGTDIETWRPYDASELVLSANYGRPILIDQGTDDNFLKQQQLLPDVFERACQQVGQPLTLRYQEGYDHSYYFISTFMGDHIRHHAHALCE